MASNKFTVSKLHWNVSLPIIVIGWLAAMTIAPLSVHGQPSWVEALAGIPDRDYGVETAAVGLIDEVRTVVRGNGEVRSYHRRAYKILNREGLELSLVTLSSDGETRISDLKAWNLKADGVIHEVDDDDGVETQFLGSGGVLFEDTKSFLLSIPQVEVGSIIAYEYERRHRPYILQDFQAFQQPYPVLRSRFELDLPNDWEFEYETLPNADFAPTQIDQNRWVWELTNLPGIPNEEGMPPFWEVADRIMVNYFPGEDSRDFGGGALRTWDELGTWFNQLSGTRHLASEEIETTARELGTVETVADFVQSQIRYVAIEIGIGGYQPHFAGETFSNRYGDCKDKVTLLRSLMAVLGREVYPVLIDTGRRKLVQEFPSPFYFNHMIAAIPVNDGEFGGLAVVEHPDLGRLLLFDPTQENTPLGQLPTYAQGTRAVLIHGGEADIIDTPLSPPITNRLLRSGSFELSPDGSLSGQLSERYWGEEAMREIAFLEQGRHDQWMQGAERFLAASLPGVRVNRFGVSGLDVRDGYVGEEYDIAVPRFGQLAGDLLVFRPAVLAERLPDIDAEEPRGYPYQFSHLRARSTTWTFTLPDGYLVETLPETLELDVPFARYRVDVTLDGEVLRFVSAFEIKTLEVLPTDVPQLQDFSSFVAGASDVAVLLRKQSAVGR